MTESLLPAHIDIEGFAQTNRKITFIGLIRMKLRKRNIDKKMVGIPSFSEKIQQAYLLSFNGLLKMSVGFLKEFSVTVT